ncbi:hypothetical protein BaRGS_00005424 [Batillaria attramentaria]|uniref:G-protein coupled receptors family 1 profile domain-containing protein n=1 Tax=Batillaria attramentaria TaxID=370345 RepID=A0ABD0LWA7_9CAEN
MNVYVAIFIPLPTVGIGVFNLAIYRRWRKSRRRVGKWTRRGAITQTRTLFEREIAGHGLSRGKDAEGLVSSSKPPPFCSSRHKEDDTGGCSSNSVRRLLPHTRQADAGGESSFVKEVVFADSGQPVDGIETSKEDREAAKTVVHGAAIKQERGAPEPPLQTDPFVSDAVDKSQPTLQTDPFVSGVVNKSHPTLQTYPCSGRSKKIVSISTTTTRRSGEHAESQPSNTKGGNGGNTRIKASDIGLVRSLLAVWVSLLVLYTPFVVGCYVSVYTGGSVELSLTINWLVFLNNSINWFLYGALNTSFRKPFLQLFTRLCRFW